MRSPNASNSNNVRNVNSDGTLHNNNAYGGGKVVRKLRRASRERMKRKLRKYKVMYESGAITKEKITESYQSWRSHASHGDCHALIQKYDQLYNEIFERSETADVSINQRPAR